MYCIYVTIETFVLLDTCVSPPTLTAHMNIEQYIHIQTHPLKYWYFYRTYIHLIIQKHTSMFKVHICVYDKYFINDFVPEYFANTVKVKTDFFSSNLFLSSKLFDTHT